MMLRSVVLLIVVLVAVPVPAQLYPTRVYTVEDGLPSSEVYGISQDARGRMWLVTRTGIVVYDGLTWTLVSRSRNPGSMTPKVRSDRQGLMWVVNPSPDVLIAGFDAPPSFGAPTFVRREWEFPDELDGQRFEVTAFAVTSREGRSPVVVGSRSHGLWLWEAGQWHHLDASDGLPDSPVRSAVGWDGNFIVATESDLCAIHGRSVDCQLGEGLPRGHGKVLALAIEERSDRPADPGLPELWILSQKALMKRVGDGFEVVEDGFELGDGLIPSTPLLVTPLGAYFGQATRLYFFDRTSGRLERLGEKNGLAADGATDLFVDREKIVWVTSQRGVTKILSQRFVNLDESTGLLENEVSAICQRDNGELVFGHNGGLTIFDGRKFEHIEFATTDHLLTVPPRVMDLLTDSQGRVFAAVSELGLARLTRDNRLIWIDRPTGVAHEAVYAVEECQQGTIVAGGSFGLVVLEKSSRLVQVPAAGQYPTVRRIACTDDGRTLAATVSSGLWELRGRELVSLTDPDEMAVHDLFTLFADSTGSVLVGTTQGLFELAGGRLVRPRRFDPPIESPVYLITEIRSGVYCFGTDDGIVVWDEGEFHWYSVQHGLAGRETNRAAALVDRNDELWIGTDNGVSRVRIDLETVVRPPPLVEVTGIQVAGEGKVKDEALELPHDRNTIVYHYSATSFIDESQLKFRFRLKGFDNAWSEPVLSRQRSVRYTNLPAGEYRFQVMAGNANGQWSDPAESASITIQKPFWESPLFAVAVVVLMVLVIIGLVRIIARWRYASQLEEEIQRRQSAEADIQSVLDELHESRSNFAAIVEENADGILVLDGNGEVEFANAASSWFLGSSRFDIVGRPLEIDLSVSEIPITRRDSSAGRAVVTSQNMKWKGCPATMVVLRDVTDQRLAEEQLLQAQKLDAVGKLAGGVAHDFNNLLQAMLSSIQYLRLNPDDRDLIESTLGDLQRGIKQGAAMTQGLLHFSRQNEPQMEVLDFNEILRQSTSLLRRLVRENIDFEVAIAPGELMILGDQNQINQVLTNLVVNACDAMSERGGRLDLRSGRQDNAVWFEIEDTGRGIAPEIRAKIFEPFFSTKDRDRGTGLGLSVVHGIVTRHGGTIEAFSREGLGTTFRITLPWAHDKRSQPIEEPLSESVSGNQERILIVEDDPAIRGTLIGILTQIGYRVWSAGSAEDALQLPDQPAMDVLLTDLVLPGDGGNTLALKLRQRWPDLAVVIMSGYADDEITQTALEVETATFLQKPFEAASLSQVLRAALDPAASASRVVVQEAKKSEETEVMKILIVEDDDDIRNLLVMFFEQHNHQVTVVDNGTEAETLLLTGTSGFDLVITDANIPGVTGEALYHKSRERGLDVPFLLCSGDPGAEQFGDGLVFLGKPFDFEELTTAVEALVGSR